MKFDLHNHSRYSDGLHTVKEVIDLASKQGLDGMALTDHDSVFGVDEAYTYGKEKGIFVVKGLELSTYYKNQTVHIVALFKKNIVPKEIYDFSKNVIDTRLARARKMMENIKRIFNVNVDFDLLFNNATIVTRGNMFQCLIKSNPGYDVDKLNYMVSNDSEAYIPASKLDTVDGLKMLKENNAICILAHPTEIKNRQLLDEIASLGFDGIEARYPKNLENEEEEFTALAKKYNLFVSAGSDFHGDVKHAMIGTSTLDFDEFQIILEKLQLSEEI